MSLKASILFSLLVSVISIAQNDTLTTNQIEFKTISETKLAYSKTNDSLYSGYEKASEFSLYHYNNGLLDEIYLFNEKNKTIRSYSKINKNGIIIIEGKFHKNAKIGDWKFYDNDGTLNCIGSYFNNKKARKWKYYRGNKEHYRTEHYRNDKLITSNFE